LLPASEREFLRGVGPLRLTKHAMAEFQRALRAISPTSM
jgi:hypothetical protein